jgi:hypothetical protein
MHACLRAFLCSIFELPLSGERTELNSLLGKSLPADGLHTLSKSDRVVLESGRNVSTKPHPKKELAVHGA